MQRYTQRKHGGRPAGAYFPAGQSKQSEAPVMFEYFPASHGLHYALTVSCSYACMHLTTSTAYDTCVTHDADYHTRTPARRIYMYGCNENLPSPLLYLPALQSVHSEAPKDRDRTPMSAPAHSR